MQSFTESASSWHRRAWDRLVRVLARREGTNPSVSRPSRQLIPIDFEGEDTSLTQAEIAILH
jgi:hypothetical protein